MLGDDRAQQHDLDDTVDDTHLDLFGDVADRDRVAGRAEPDTTQPVDLADHELADLGA